MNLKLKIATALVSLSLLGMTTQKLKALDAVEDLYLGGIATVFQSNNQAFSLPFPTLSGIERLQFQAGDALFTEPWVTSPSSTVGRDGLGPLMITSACANCHLQDGRGAPPADETVEPLGFLVRLSSSEAHAYGDQIQNRAILGQAPEASIKVSWTEQPGVFADGVTYSLRYPTIRLENLAYGPLPSNLQMSGRIAPPVHGLGLIDSVSAETILEYADPDDANGDGISGRANYVMSSTTHKLEIGRFGWKANQDSLRDQDASAFNGDMGLTSTLFPDSNCSPMQKLCDELPNGGTPEVTDKQMNLVFHYSRFIAVPARRNTDDETVKKGRELFMEANCQACHRPTMTTRADTDHVLLASQKIWPYSDLLLHDMGPGLADNRPDGLASGTEWRTSLLWGIGVTKEVNGREFFLHDGRARSVEEAILWHGGEGEKSRNAYMAMPEDSRKALLAFLKSL